MTAETQEYRELKDKHLSALTQYGVHFTGLAASAANMLRMEFLGEIELAEDEKKKIFDALVNSIDKHYELVKRTIDERRAYGESISDEDGN